MEHQRLVGIILNGRPNARSLLAFGIVFAVHTVFIIMLLNEKVRSTAHAQERILKMIYVSQEREEDVVEPQLPGLPPVRAIPLVVPAVKFYDSSPPLSVSPSDKSSFDLPAQHDGVFDPKMRQKLMDAKRFKQSDAQEKSRVWTSIDGRTYIEMGNGVCMVSMSKVDSCDRATNWGVTNCGKNDSEKAMVRVMADFESRKSSPNAR